MLIKINTKTVHIDVGPITLADLLCTLKDVPEDAEVEIKNSRIELKWKENV